MPTTMRKIFRYIACLFTAVLFLNIPSLYAAGPPAPSAFDNTLTIGFLILMLILLLIIFMLANLLLGVAQVKMKNEKKLSQEAKAAVTAAVLLFFFSSPMFAQTSAGSADAVKTAETIGGVSATAFYMMASVIFVELLVIFVLLLNVRTLLKVEKQRAEIAERTFAWKAKFSNLWVKLNSFKSPEQEADIDLGHNYDGIRELDNRLPPWWIYGFYLTIVVAGIYLYRYHVSHTGASSIQEYETAIAKADIEVKEYLKSKGDAVDENTVTLLTAPDEIATGKVIFTKSCIACHNEGGAGNVGPNLTDDYWLHGGDIKSIFKTIRYGINAMPQWQNSYSNKEIAALTSYVKSLKGTKPANPKAPQGVLVTDEAAPAKPAADSTVKVSSVITSH